MITVELYTRAGCHLCEEALEMIRGARCPTPYQLHLIDVDANPDLGDRFGEEVPVVFIDGKKAFKYRVDPGLFCQRLCRLHHAQDGSYR